MDEAIEGIMNELVDEDIELAVDSFSTRGPGLVALMSFQILWAH